MNKKVTLLLALLTFFLAGPLLAGEELMSRLAFDNWLKESTAPLELQISKVGAALRETREIADQLRKQLTTEIKLVVAQTKALVDGKEVYLDAPPALVNGRTMVPVRFIGEAFGAEFSWEEKTRKVTFTLDQQTIVLNIGKNTAAVNGKSVTLDAAPYISQGRTMVPLRFIGQYMGASFGWDGSTQTVTVTR